MRGNPLRLVLVTGGVVAGGFLGLSFVSSFAIQGLRAVTEAKRKKTAPPCAVCKGRGVMECKLCRGNANIEWSPLYDPVVTKPCVCPTCEGNRVQRCLNCLGKGYA